MTNPIDPKAWKILHDTYFGRDGWKRDEQRSVPDDDFRYAKEKGLMFDPVPMTHEQAVMTVCEAVDRLDRRTVADAFLASLSTRRLDWRSALGSYSVFEHMLPHEVTAAGVACAICGWYVSRTVHDWNIYNFYRFKWGGVPHLDLAFAAMDLTVFMREEAPKPTREDIEIFRAIVDVIRAAEPGLTAAKLQARLPKSLKSNKAERDILVGILGFCDVLAGPDHPGFSDVFLLPMQRRLPDRHFVDMAYPACWWTGAIGSNEARLQERFGHVL
ncbi:hypothetical protein L2Y96_13040 [Luteibacter aegosomaticola]|uniref:hypothetical protein n=1 Tax=Luteibacter aegosomaticola TaxID=2911538 RepID=UPI001FFB7A9E|nr:hypothetical protein [Luteibacter aegosomaticola]UPG88345.1 hypothetical protein L2Y96_13040 [Luteibacter aegosomaticola]